jgi:hypothetical protein
MKRMILFCCCITGVLSAIAQHNSTDFKDAATTGPFPIYFGVGFANSFRNQDFINVGRAFYEFNNIDLRVRTRMYGINIFAGASIVQEGWPISIVTEVRHLLLTRTVNANADYFTMRSNQTTFGLGVRYAKFPIVLQLQAGPVLMYKRDYDFGLDNSKRRFRHHPGFAGWGTLFRISILDPAGTEGGLGIFIETGFNFIRAGNNDDITKAIQMFQEDFAVSREAKRRYGYLSAGILLPIAIRIK